MRRGSGPRRTHDRDGMAMSTNPNFELLQQLIERNSPAILSLPSAGMLRHHTTRFLAGTDDGFWIESTPDDASLVDELIAAEAPVGVVCKHADKSLAFAVPIRHREPSFRVNPTTRAEALFLPLPDNFRKEQRRKSYRVSLPLEHPYAIKLWRIPEHAVLRDRPLAALEIPAKLKNLCVNGMGVLCMPGRDKQPPKMLINERIRVQLTYGKDPLIFEARVMHRRPAGENVVAGLMFQKLDKDLEGRRIAAKINELVGLLSREELKRNRAVAVPA